MRSMMSYLIAGLAALGLLTSIVVNFSTFVGINPVDVFPPVWLLHVGIFLVLIAATALAKDSRRRNEDSTQTELEHAPQWMINAMAVFFVYAVINTAIFIFQMEGSPRRNDDGSFTVHDEFVREISEEEFHHLQAF